MRRWVMLAVRRGSLLRGQVGVATSTRTPSPLVSPQGMDVWCVGFIQPSEVVNTI